MQETICNEKKDDVAKNIGLITGISNEIYFCSISRYSAVYVECINGSWIAWRESHNGSKSNGYKLIANGSFELAMARTKDYLKYIKKMQRRKFNDHTT